MQGWMRYELRLINKLAEWDERDLDLDQRRCAKFRRCSFTRRNCLEVETAFLFNDADNDFLKALDCYVGLKTIQPLHPMDEGKINYGRINGVLADLNKKNKKPTRFLNDIALVTANKIINGLPQNLDDYYILYRLAKKKDIQDIIDDYENTRSKYRISFETPCFWSSSLRSDLGDITPNDSERVMLIVLVNPQSLEGYISQFHRSGGGTLWDQEEMLILPNATGLILDYRLIKNTLQPYEVMVMELQKQCVDSSVDEPIPQREEQLASYEDYPQLFTEAEMMENRQDSEIAFLGLTMKMYQRPKK
ncbi:hypothetical protein [Bifidobacterium sp. ESL0790]|uniref:hypothetical protein n=1 Tax=Bifidobacterium sp. ESL0790 TaxID=2983233 RepID=UPI0023F8FE87|nr:hypothetical protein [Bifidobacterium sp. ESL0790]WEV73103.1 hypothetical protein OZY47_03940 [Bifidobacterium sp. ESL0790]